jgi:Tfp pilus assembly protein PilO
VSATTHRQYAAEGAIILAICAGAWLMFIEPRERRAAQLDASIEQIGSTDVDAVTGQMAALGAQAATMRARASDLLARNAFATDAAHLYDAIRTVARESGLDVNRISPSTRSSAKGQGGAAVTRVSIELIAPFASIPDFLDGIARIDGFVRQAELALAPTDESGRCTVRLDVELLQLPIESAVADVLEGGGS